MVKQPGLDVFGQVRGKPLPRFLEKAAHRRQVGGKSAEALHAVAVLTLKNTGVVNLYTRFLMQPRLATVDHGLVERLQAVQFFRSMGNARL